MIRLQKSYLIADREKKEGNLLLKKREEVKREKKKTSYIVRSFNKNCNGLEKSGVTTSLTTKYVWQEFVE